MNLAYKHLNSKLKIAELSIGQWASVLVGVLVGIGWARFVSPFGTYLTLISTVYIAGVPVAAAFVAAAPEFDLWQYVRAAVAFHRRPGRFQPGAGETAMGYVIYSDEADEADVDPNTPNLDLESLWHVA